jgi:DNA-binding response OmpR family regulator
LVEDDRALASAVAEALARRLFVVDRARRLDEAHAALQIAGSYDVVLLDRRLPDGEGTELLPSLARCQPRPYVLFLTARDTLADRVEGLEAGGDDYLVKPFEMDELVARIRAVLRRPAIAPNQLVAFGKLTFDPSTMQVSVAGTELELPRRELLALASLMRANGKGVLRETLMRDVYGLDDAVQPNALEGHLSRLRTKLRLSQANASIRTIRGVGYQMVKNQDGMGTA